MVDEDEFETTRYLTKQDLIEANNAAIREKRSRTLSKEFVESLPDDFICVVFREYYHTKNEMRIGFSVDLKGNWALLDVSMTRFFALPMSKTYKDGRVELESPEAIAKKRPYPNMRHWKETLIKKPLRKQDDFRKCVLEAYQNKCAVCDVQIPALLRAAHIVPVVNSDDDSIQNGICLCANHEIAFDAGLLRIFTDYSACLYDESSRESKTIFIMFPKDPEKKPLKANLAYKLELLCPRGYDLKNS